MTARRPRIGFAGMTHLGLVSAAAAAGSGFEVAAFDPDKALVARLEAGQLPVVEPSLPELVAQTRAAGRLSFGGDSGTLAGCDVVYVAPDVPTDAQGGSDLAGLEALFSAVVAATPATTTVVFLSQVPPGFTRAHQIAGRTVLCQVETLIFGRAVERALKPERYMVGCADPSKPLPPAFLACLETYGCPILPMRFESAELAKISINMFLVASVSTTNMLAELCEKIGADWNEIAPSLRLDRRIGPHAYLAPGLGIAGGNLERDLATVRRLADANGTDAGLIDAWRTSSRHRRDWALGQLHASLLACRRDPLVAVLGIAYKENTHSIKNSPSLSLLAALSPFRIRAFDPAVAADRAFHPRIEAAAGAMACVAGADALVVMTPWPEFRSLVPATIAAAMSGRLVVDPYGVLDGAACAVAGLDHRVLGRPEC
ncbi:MAG: UDP-glucose/GDP-mannose dehydrogenase family protein [Proteobacteria bacterium]|nr:UDP-glucose/GDP-mannose dehydrogenase family protein [Pseudomonadota bacterium]